MCGKRAVRGKQREIAAEGTERNDLLHALEIDKISCNFFGFSLRFVCEKPKKFSDITFSPNN